MEIIVIAGLVVLVLWALARAQQDINADIERHMRGE
jgi:high-affinity Fe2+/Pb2+ permease